jgi:hypothetical protein
MVTRDPPNMGHTLLSVQEFKFLLLFGGYKIVTRKDNFFASRNGMLTLLKLEI